MRLRNTGYILITLHDVKSHKTIILNNGIFRRRHRTTKTAMKFSMNSENDRMSLLEIRQSQAQANTLRQCFTLVCFMYFCFKAPLTIYINFLDFKLSPCSVCRMLSFG